MYKIVFNPHEGIFELVEEREGDLELGEDYHYLDTSPTFKTINSYSFLEEAIASNPFIEFDEDFEYPFPYIGYGADES